VPSSSSSRRRRRRRREEEEERDGDGDGDDDEQEERDGDGNAREGGIGGELEEEDGGGYSTTADSSSYYYYGSDATTALDGSIDNTNRRAYFDGVAGLAGRGGGGGAVVSRRRRRRRGRQSRGPFSSGDDGGGGGGGDSGGGGGGGDFGGDYYDDDDGKGHPPPPPPPRKQLRRYFSALGFGFGGSRRPEPQKKNKKRPTATASSKNSSSSFFKRAASSSSFRWCGPSAQMLLLLLAAAYSVVMLRVYDRISSSSANGGPTIANENNYNNMAALLPFFGQSSSSSLSSAAADQFRSLVGGGGGEFLFGGFHSRDSLEKRRSRRSFLEERKSQDRRKARRDAEDRALARRRGTRPTTTTSRFRGGGGGGGRRQPQRQHQQQQRRDDSKFLVRYSIRTQADRSLPFSNDEIADAGVPPPAAEATMRELCGYFAQNASLSVPRAYSKRNALGFGSGTPSSSQPRRRVLLAGHVLTSGIAIHLATYLRQECDPLLEIIGFDLSGQEFASASGTSMYDLLKPTQYLQRIWNESISFAPQSLGFVPKQLSSSTKFHVLTTTGQVDVVRAYDPSHIVFFPPPSADLQGRHKKPYSLYRTQIAFEQLLGSIAANNARGDQQQPQLVFLSAYNSSSLEVLANTYAALRGVRSVAVRLASNTTVYGPSEGTVGADHQPHSINGMFRDVVLNETRPTATVTTAPNGGVAVSTTTTTFSEPSLELLYVGDVAEGLVAALQVQLPVKSSVLEFRASASSGRLRNQQQLESNLQQLFRSSSGRERGDIDKIGSEYQGQRQQRSVVVQEGQSLSAAATTTSSGLSTNPLSLAHNLTQQYLQWYPATPLEEGLVRTLAWHFDRQYPYGTRTVKKSSGDATTSVSAESPATTIESGDDLLLRHSITTCPSDDLVCSLSDQPPLPCLSECNSHAQCLPSIFDGMLPVLEDVLEGCTVVLYTHAFGTHVDDLQLETEYMEEGELLVCGIAFVSFESVLVEKAMQRVPDADLAKLGVLPVHHRSSPAADPITQLKREKLNGRLLYRGWLLLWPTATVTTDTVSATTTASSGSGAGHLTPEDEYLLKLAPGKLFNSASGSGIIEKAVYLDQQFSVSPKLDDILFLVDQLRRQAIPSRTVHHKIAKSTANGVKTSVRYIRLPAEPEKRAAMLLSQMRNQESSSDPMSQQYSIPKKKLTTKQATRYMRFENGESDPLQKQEPLAVKQQREFYDRLVSLANRRGSQSSASTEKVYNIELNHHWIRSRWIVHDLQLEDARELRCDWYTEQLRWPLSKLDQLSFAFVMGKREFERREALEEYDDRALRVLNAQESTEIKAAVTDAFEWHLLKQCPNAANSQQRASNKGYPYDPPVEVLGYDASLMENQEQQEAEGQEQEDDAGETASSSESPPLFVRIVSDRFLAASRKAWNEARKKTQSKEDQ